MSLPGDFLESFVEIIHFASFVTQILNEMIFVVFGKEILKVAVGSLTTCWCALQQTVSAVSAAGTFHVAWPAYIVAATVAFPTA